MWVLLKFQEKRYKFVEFFCLDQTKTFFMNWPPQNNNSTSKDYKIEIDQIKKKFFRFL